MKQREIKFRAWNKKKKEMRDVCSLHNSTQPYFVSVYDEEKGEIDWFDDLIIMQFTGLKDKNGVEIYEEDLLSNDVGAPVMRVEFNQGCFTLNGLENLISEEVDHTQCLEIIGNIYENPELLKEK
jgi:uncharacterized phage protein (TIGR01671 family)